MERTIFRAQIGVTQKNYDFGVTQTFRVRKNPKTTSDVIFLGLVAAKIIFGRPVANIIKLLNTKY